MATNIKGPAIFLAQFAGDAAPFNSWDAITKWAASLGYKGVQIPSWDGRLFDLKKAAESKTYCDEVKGVAQAATASRSPSCRPICRASSSPCIRPMTRPSMPSRPQAVHGKPEGAPGWAVEQVKYGRQGLAQPRPRRACHLLRRAGLALPLSLAAAPGGPDRGRPSTSWRGAGSRSSTSSTRTASTSASSSIPARTCIDGVTFEMFLERLGNHPRCMINYDPSHFVLQQLDYLDFIDIYHERICAFHVKDAEFNPDRPAGRLFAASSPGSTAPAASARWATGRSISAASSRSSRRTTTTAGRCSNGNAASSIRSRAPPKARPSSRATSSGSPRRPSTTSPAGGSRQGQDPPHARHQVRTKAHGYRRKQAKTNTRPHPARHGGRRAGRLHRRRAPPRRAHGRPV